MNGWDSPCAWSVVQKVTMPSRQQPLLLLDFSARLPLKRLLILARSLIVKKHPLLIRSAFFFCPFKLTGVRSDALRTDNK